MRTRGKGVKKSKHFVDIISGSSRAMMPHVVLVPRIACTMLHGVLQAPISERFSAVTPRILRHSEEENYFRKGQVKLTKHFLVNVAHESTSLSQTQPSVAASSPRLLNYEQSGRHS